MVEKEESSKSAGNVPELVEGTKNKEIEQIGTSKSTFKVKSIGKGKTNKFTSGEEGLIEAEKVSIKQIESTIETTKTTPAPEMTEDKPGSPKIEHLDRKTVSLKINQDSTAQDHTSKINKTDIKKKQVETRAIKEDCKKSKVQEGYPDEQVSLQDNPTIGKERATVEIEQEKQR